MSEQVNAISCSGSASSPSVQINVVIVESPVLLLSLTFEGNLSQSQMSEDMKEKMESAIASSLGVSPAIVELISFTNTLRRLLAFSVTFRILAVSAEDVVVLQSKAATANFAKPIKQQTGLDLEISSVNADIVQQQPAKDVGSNVVAAAVAGVVGILVLFTALLVVAIYWSKKNKKAKVLSEECPHLVPSQFTQALDTPEEDLSTLEVT